MLWDSHMCSDMMSTLSRHAEVALQIVVKLPYCYSHGSRFDCAQTNLLCLWLMSAVDHLCVPLQACNGKKGVVYDYFFQYCSAVTLTNSSWWINFDAGYDYSCTGQQPCLHIQQYERMLSNSYHISNLSSVPAFACSYQALLSQIPQRVPKIYSFGNLHDVKIAIATS